MSASPKHGVVFDFDGTLTPKRFGSLFKIVDTRALPPEAEPDFRALRDRFIPLSEAGRLSPELQLEWLGETFEIYIRHRLTRGAWMHAIEQVVAFRSMLFITLIDLKIAGVPTAVISYGSADFIEHALECDGQRRLISEVYATRMRHDADGLVTGYDRSSLVTQDNKGEWSRVFAEKYGIPLENLLAVGDTAGDRYLGHLKEKRFGLAADETERAKLAPDMGETAVTDDFTPARAWLYKHLGLPL